VKLLTKLFGFSKMNLIYNNIVMLKISLHYVKNMARKKISLTETKREKFLRLATLRTKEALSRLRILGNCANRQIYEYNETDVKKIFSAIEKQLSGIKAKFHFPKKEEFKL